jgi:hypothetical protein
MTADRTVTVPTTDHGPVTIPEPAWCAGRHPAGYLRSEIAHEGPTISVMAATERGPRPMVHLSLWQDPFPTPACRHSDDVHVAVRLIDGDTYDYDVPGLEGLAVDLMEAAGKVRRMARRLAAEGGAR